MRKTILFSLFIAFANSLLAQGGADNLFRSNQKIYVVVAVLLIILLGIVFFLFSLEKRLKQLEDKK